jgi:hypothetical protein
MFEFERSLYGPTPKPKPEEAKLTIQEALITF